MKTDVLVPKDISLVNLVYPLKPTGRYGFTANGFPVHRCSWLPRDVVGICQLGEDGLPNIQWFKIEEENA